MQGGLITDTTGFGQISMSAAPLTNNPFISLLPGCTSYAGDDGRGPNKGILDNPGPGGNILLPYAVGCKAALYINGDENIVGLLSAYKLYAGTFIYQSSDLRLKKDIHPLTDSLEKIMRLKPVNFKFKANNEQSEGFIAQDIEKIYPELVSENPNGMKAVNYEGLIAPLIKAVQELKLENDELRRDLEKQKHSQ